MGAVSADSRTGDFGTAYGITSDTAILVPKYSFSLGKEMTAYTGFVTLVQLSASTIGDRNPVSYDVGISVIKNVLTATKRLKEDPEDADARGVILYGASISTSGRLGLGKEENYAYEIYELEFIPEVLYGSTYRKSLTTLFPDSWRRCRSIMRPTSAATSLTHSDMRMTSQIPEENSSNFLRNSEWICTSTEKHPPKKSGT